MKRSVIVGLLLAVMLVTACSNNPQTPQPTPTISPVAEPATTSSPTPVAAAPSASAATTPTTAGAAVASASPAASTPADVVEFGRTITHTTVYADPSLTSDILGELPAESAIIVTRQLDDWYEIIFAPEVRSHGWVPQAVVSLGTAASTATTTATAAAEATAAPNATRQPVAVATPRPTRSAAGSGSLAGKLVFQDRSGGSIYVMNADGSGLRRLTSGFEPALSPDGRRVAFTRWDEPRGLWVIDIDGSGEQFLSGANRARSPTWSPDGGTIVFERMNKSRVCRNTPFGCLTDDEWRARFGGDCITTPFGTLCLDDYSPFTLFETNLTSYDVATGTTRDLPASVTASAPGHHPTQDRVVFVDDEGLAATGTTGDAAPQRLVQAPNLLGPATYSPDGQWLYGSRRSHDHWDIWRWSADGGAATALTAPPGLRDRAISSYAPAVSPDGSSVVFLSDREGTWQLWIMNADGSNQRPLAPGALAGITFQVDFNDERMVDWGN